MTKTLVTISSCLAIAGGWILIPTLLRPGAARAEASVIHLQPISHEAYDPAKIDREIKFHEGRVAADPGGAIGYAMLAEAYLARSRESDSDVFAWKAEEAARKSLELRKKMNEVAYNRLIQSLLEQHRLKDALAETRSALERFPDDRSLSRLLADCLIEIGQEAEAKKVLARFSRKDEDAQWMAIVARLKGLEGDHRGAIAMYQKGYQLLLGNRSIAEDTLGWFRTKIGTEHEGLGQWDEAQAEYTQALKLSPRSYKALLGMTRVAAAKRDWSGSIAWAEKVLEVANSLDAVAAIGDAQKALGKTAEAEATYAKVHEMYLQEVANFDRLGKGGPLHVKPIDRQFATFAARHHMFQKEALMAAERDAANRPDRIAQSNLSALRGVR